MALALHGQDGAARRKRRTAVLVTMGLFGAALLYGDGIITPPISVLGAMEGLIVVAPSFERYVVPAAFAILLLLFLAQRFGTQTIGSVFGPVIAIWFLTIGSLGAVEIVRGPGILLALNPYYAARFLFDHGVGGWASSGPWSWPSPGPRRSTRTWATSAKSRSGSSSSASCCRD